MSKFRPICVPCRREMRCKQNEYMVTMSGCAVYSGDMYECPNCETQIVTGFGREPVAYEHEASFERWRKRSLLEVAIG